MPEGTDVYSEFVKALIDAEASRKNSLESRAINVITTSGTLVTLLFALTAAITASKTFTFPVAARGWLVGSGGLFVAAAAISVAVNSPFFYTPSYLTVQDLRDLWSSTYTDAQAGVAGTRLVALARARSVNTVKAVLLLIAQATQIVGLLVLAIGIYVILQSQHSSGATVPAGHVTPPSSPVPTVPAGH